MFFFLPQEQWITVQFFVSVVFMDSCGALCFSPCMPSPYLLVVTFHCIWSKQTWDHAVKLIFESQKQRSLESTSATCRSFKIDAFIYMHTCFYSHIFDDKLIICTFIWQNFTWACGKTNLRFFRKHYQYDKPKYKGHWFHKYSGLAIVSVPDKEWGFVNKLSS